METPIEWARLARTIEIMERLGTAFHETEESATAFVSNLPPPEYEGNRAERRAAAAKERRKKKGVRPWQIRR